MIERARQAATERLKQAAVDAREGAGHVAAATQKAAVAGAGRAAETLKDPVTHAKARRAVVRAGASAGRGVRSALDRINPGMLATVVMKATALQEEANAHLQKAGSLYRIGGISIGAAIPPSVTFQIVRLADLDPSVAARLDPNSSLNSLGSGGGETLP